MDVDTTARRIWCQFARTRELWLADGVAKESHAMVSFATVWLKSLRAEAEPFIDRDPRVSAEAKELWAVARGAISNLESSVISAGFSFEFIARNAAEVDVALDDASREMPEEWKPDGSEANKP